MANVELRMSHKEFTIVFGKKLETFDFIASSVKYRIRSEFFDSASVVGNLLVALVWRNRRMGVSGSVSGKFFDSSGHLR